MPILQQQPRDTEIPEQIAADSLNPPRDPEYPHAPAAATTRNAVMPLIFWSLALLLGILVLFVRSPLHAPPFESLTQYVCDPMPMLPRLGYRLQTYPLNLRCRTGDQVLLQRQAVIDGSNPTGLKACRQQGGLTRIWRMAPPSPYGAYVFHSTCADYITMYYKNRAAGYESTQRFVTALASLIVLGSTIGLTATLTKRFRMRKPHSFS